MNRTKKFLIFSLFILGITLLSSSREVKNPLDDRYDNILHSAGFLLQRVHYSPQNINDDFSAKVFSAYFKELDPEKVIFLQADLKELSKYNHAIDEEIRQAPVEFFYKVNALYKTRLAEIKNNCAALAEKPFQFVEADSIVSNYEQRSFASSTKEQLLEWQKKLKYFALEKLVDLQEQQVKDTIQASLKKSDAELEIQARNFAKTTLEKLLDRLLNKTTDDDRFSLFMSAIVNSIDPHTDFFMPVEKRSWDERLTGKFFGIGALIGEENGYIKISSVSQGGPAWKTTEVNDGDLVLKIAQGDDAPVDVAGYDIPDAVKLIRGNKGTVVKLTLKKADGTVKVVAIVREELTLEETFAKSCTINEGPKKTGYIYLPKFYTAFGEEKGRSCANDVANELLKLQKEKVDGIILDLRDNGGGSLAEVVKMVGLFIPDGPVVQVKDNDGKSSFLSDDDDGSIVYSGPLVVMVNEFSASASEIFAAAIQDYKRGVIIGSSSTYGKGTVQRPIPLNRVKQNSEDLGTVHLTMQKYYRINGSSTQLKGVEPDIVLPGYYEQYKLREKDNPNALAWDEISKLSYSLWTNQPNLEVLRQGFQKRDSSGGIKKIQQNAAWLASQNEAPDQLNLQKYKEKMQAVRAKAAQTRELLTLTSPMNITKTETSTAANAPLSNPEINNRWLNYLKKDRYLHEASLVLNDLLLSPGLTSTSKPAPAKKN